MLVGGAAVIRGVPKSKMKWDWALVQEIRTGSVHGPGAGQWVLRGI